MGLIFSAGIGVRPEGASVAPTVKVEYARSNRGKCTQCKATIDKVSFSFYFFISHDVVHFHLQSFPLSVYWVLGSLVLAKQGEQNWN